MFLVNLWNNIRGYVTIIVSGQNIERFINICSKRNILLWDIVRTGPESAQMRASIKGFKLMRPAAKKSGCRAHIIKRSGLPFAFNRFRRRKGFKLGVFIFCILLTLTMSIIWDIEVRGGSEEINNQIMSELAVNNIYRGSLKMKLNPKKIATDLALNIKDIAWVGVEVKGVKLYITYKDSIDTPTIIDNGEPQNIVAKRDGIIKLLEVHAGNAIVKEGDTVKEGQLLISGVIESQNPEFGSREVHALGRVIARTWYESSLPVSNQYTQRVKSGKTNKVVYLRLLDSKIKFPAKPEPFVMFETEVEEKLVKGPFGLNLPIGLTIETSSEIMEKKVDISPEEAIDVAIEMAREDLSKRISKESKIINEVINQVAGEDNTVYIQVIIECEEDIARFAPVNN